MANPIKVLIVEDSPLASTLLSFIINADPELLVIGSVSSGEEALEFIKGIKPDVITMDIVLTGMDGLLWQWFKSF
jgi:two-component system chemotaxis response regulator CheB